MKHIDPASTAFLALSSREQAQILHQFYHWKTSALAEEYGVTVQCARMWVNPEVYQRNLERKKLRKRQRRIRRFITPDLIAEIRHRKQSGQTSQQVASAMKIGVRTVTRYGSRSGVPADAGRAGGPIGPEPLRVSAVPALIADAEPA